MKRGTTQSRLTPRGQTLSRVLVTRRYDLAHRKETCLGCGLCAAVCPQKAIALSPAAVTDGRLARRPRPVLDPARCNFCGECAVVCPSHSLALTIDGAARLPVVEAEAFPRLVAAVDINLAACKPDCGLACQSSCPVNAITVTAASEGETVTRIAAVAVDEDRCFYCGKCEVACPEGALHVRKPLDGAVALATSLCPAGCQACADACPSEAIVPSGCRGAVTAPTGGETPPLQATASPCRGDLLVALGVTVDERNCFYCGACAEACPAEGALSVIRSRAVHTPVKSAAWTKALGAILSPAAQARELDALARRRTRQAAAGLLGAK